MCPIYGSKWSGIGSIELNKNETKTYKLEID